MSQPPQHPFDRAGCPPLVPDAALALDIAARVTGRTPRTARRFATGTQHYVFEVELAEGPAVVVRLGNASAHAEMGGAAQLSARLRPRGVPLPALLGADVEAALPWLVLERLPGTDLGAVIADLSQPQLERIAGHVAKAQAAAAGTESAGRYGYAVHPEEAPHAAWSAVLAANLHRSRRRIAAAQLFDAALVDVSEEILDRLRADLDRIAPTPFLHDTTTKNVIVTPDGGFSGIVDVDDLCFGDPRYPAALTLAVLSARRAPTHYVTAWLRHAGAADDGIFRFYVGLFHLDLMGEHGHAFNGNQAPSAPEGRAALLRAFEENLVRLGG